MGYHTHFSPFRVPLYIQVFSSACTNAFIRSQPFPCFLLLNESSYTSCWANICHIMIWGKNLQITLRKNITIHQVTTMLATSKNVLFLGHNHLLTNGTDDPSLTGAWSIIKMSDHQYRWLAGGYDLDIGHF